MKEKLEALLARVLEPFTPDLDELSVEIEYEEVISELEHGRKAKVIDRLLVHRDQQRAAA